jgi:zinc carboxypeptidase
MRRWTIVACALVAVLAWGGVAQAGAKRQVSLNFYRATVSQATYQKMLAKHVDIAAAATRGQKVTLQMVLTKGQVRALRADGVSVTLIRNSKGQTARQAAAAQMTSGFSVWRDYDGSDGIRAWMYKTARENPQLVKLEVIGHTGQGREIIALKMTQAAKEVPDNSRPAVLYSSTQHAREWISTEVNRRLVQWLVDRWRANDKPIKDLLKQRELWFVLVCNPDGYQYTFQSPGTRLWRKTLTEQNGTPGTQVGDGVDPNRNYPAHWNYDGEGSSGAISSDTYRGPSAASLPETQAIAGLFDRVDFRLQSNFHSFGPWLLYPQGWQIGTPTADDPIFYALAGNRDNPAIPGFRPGLSSDVLYVTNGEMTDFAYSRRGTISYTPELNEGCTGCGFVFPDNEALVEAEFHKTLAFDLDLAKSAADPAHPTSHLGITTKPFYLKSDDTYKFGLPEANFTFRYSYGDPQPVQVLALRSLGAVTAKWKVNGGATQSASTSEWGVAGSGDGEKFDESTSRWYHVMRGQVTGTSPGDSVEVWFEAGGVRSPSFTYQAVNESTNDVLILAAEDYTGASQYQPGGPGPAYLSYYQDALAANGLTADVYDVDARGRVSPTYLGVLSHYNAVVWYTGDDVVTREPGWSPGNASRLAMDELLHVRSYLNEGGKVLYTGQAAGHQYTTVHGAQNYDPTEANARCTTPPAPTLARCLILYGSPSSDLQNDVIEYWFGAFLTNHFAGFDDDGNNLDVIGTNTPLTGSTMSFNGGDSADNQFFDDASFITTSGILDPATYPQFESWVAAKYDRPGGPFDPHSGTRYAYSQIADQTFKRLVHTVNVPAGGATMSFWTSYNTEFDWDHVFVEAHTVGQDDWTTLEDLNGNTDQTTGESCKPENGPGGWRTIHPFMDHYQTIVDDDCVPHGTTGDWWAISGNSGGWQQWNVNLAGPGNRFAGKQIEVSISYVSDWASQGLGMFVDDIVVSTGEGSTDFESGDGGWTMPPAPAGSAPNTNTWIVTDATGFPEGAVVATPDTLYMGFGFEGITDAATRNEVMGKAMDYLLN